MSGRQFAREIFSAFWSGNKAHSVATLVYFPVWAKDSDFLNMIMTKTHSYEPSRWAVDSAMSNLQHRIYTDASYVVPYANLLSHAARLFDQYVHPSKSLHVYIHGLWLDMSSPYDRQYSLTSLSIEDRGEPWEACWRYRTYGAFWQKHGRSLPFAAVLTVVREKPYMIGTVRENMFPGHEEPLRRAVRAMWNTLSEENSLHIYRQYPEAFNGFPVPLLIQKEKARNLLENCFRRGPLAAGKTTGRTHSNPNLAELQTAVASGQMDVLDGPPFEGLW